MKDSDVAFLAEAPDTITKISLPDQIKSARTAWPANKAETSSSLVIVEGKLMWGMFSFVKKG